MIRLDRVELLHWDMQPHQVLPLARGVTLLTGENASGKTSILDAIKVALGASRLDGDRTVDEYLAKQAKPVVMIRVLADNRPMPVSRQRPFDRLGDVSTDLVTLGVVFRAAEDGEYSKDYLLVGGDVVPPLEPGHRGFRFLGPVEYRARLAKVGITPRYLKLLSLAQGKIAELCRRDPTALFDDLYDIIGGRHALEEWERRLVELAEKQKEHAGTKSDLTAARLRLEALGGQARRHQSWTRIRSRLVAIRAAIPYAEFNEAQAKVDQLTQRVRKLTAECQALLEKEETARRKKKDADDGLAGLAEEKERLKKTLDLNDAQRVSIQSEAARIAARLELLDELKEAASGISWDDLESLSAQLEDEQVKIAKIRAEKESQAAEVAGLEDQLEAVRKGLLPLPPDVTCFQETLRREGIAHHLLHEVIEVEEVDWQPALEGLLGRLRFAVVVGDAESWSRAAALARRERYVHGVLVPDVRSHSAADVESAFRLLRVNDDSYRALVARLMRQVSTGDHPDPIAPGDRNDVLSRDGFVVSRLEARFADPGQHVIGRQALARRERDLKESMQALVIVREQLRKQEADQREILESLKRRVEEQERLRAWEERRQEHADLTERGVETRSSLDGIGISMVAQKEELDVLDERTLSLVAAATAAVLEADSAHAEGEAKESDRASEATELAEAQAHLGILLARPLDPPTPEVNAELENAPAFRTLHALEKEMNGQEQAFSPDERDPMLPVNHQRQEAEVSAVEERLRQLGEALEKTREAAERAQREYQQTTRLVFRGYFGRLAEDAAPLDFNIKGTLEAADTGRFRCDVRIGVSDKPPVSYSSNDLSGGQKAALSILMAMTAVSHEADGVGFFLVDEPFSASDVIKMNELGEFLARSGAQYLVSMPTSADIGQCGAWLAATWTCTKSRGGFDDKGRPVLAPRVKIAFAPGARDG